MSQSTHPPKIVAIYCRVSSTSQEDNSSLETQEAACRAFAEERNWRVSAVYREVHTGAELFERAELTQLRDAMRRGEFDVLLVHALDRLSRKQTHQGLILSEAEHASVHWVSVTEDIDDSPQGQILRAVIGGMAELERLKIAERTIRGRRARAHAGKLLPGKAALYGYRWRDATKAAYDIDPIHGPIIQRIFNEMLAGRTIRSIASRLTNDGFPTPTGGTKWSPSTIHTMLKQRSYTGEAVAWRYASERIKGGGYRTFERPESEQASLPSGTVPALISLSDFEAVQHRLQRNRDQATRNNRAPEASLLRGGFARCGYCGTVLSVVTKEGLVYYRHGSRSRDQYECPAVTIRTDRLDTVVWRRVSEILTEPDVIAAEVARRREYDPGAADLVVVKRRLQDTSRRQTNLIGRLALIDDEDAAGLITAEINALSSQKRQLIEEQTALERQQAEWHATAQQLAQLDEWCRRVATNLPTLAYEQKRMLLEALDVAVRLYHTNHRPRYEIRASIPAIDPIVSTST
jgi:site-specific DNA recombinase